MIIITSTNKKGNTDLTTLSILIPPAALATFRTVPTGGVSSPITIDITKTTPKYTSLIPASLITGKTTGASINIVGLPSIVVPIHNINPSIIPTSNPAASTH